VTAGDTEAAGPLAGIKVVDLSRVLAGPYTASVLAELGADVIKVESPDGDPARSIGPFVDGRSLYFASVNSDKRGICLDLKSDAGRADLDALLATTDIVVENFLPAVGRRLGVAPTQLLERHPHLVVVSVSGYAHGSDEERRPVLDLVVQAESGIMSVTGEPGGAPVRAGVPIGDLAAGLWGAVAALAGVASRERDGRGLPVEVSPPSATVSMLSYMGTAALASGEDPPRVGSGHHSVVPYGAYPSADGWVVIAVIGDHFFGRLCDALSLDELADDADLGSNAGRTEHRARIDGAISRATAARTTAELRTLLDRAGVPHAPVNGLVEALTAPYVAHRSLVETRGRETPYRIVRGPIAAEGRRRRPAPAVGEHTEEILREIGRRPPVA
jgi:crotonobetainyl-CoA:carnitine CoA-transferase CaiB-like acyl-CoA transferase